MKHLTFYFSLAVILFSLCAFKTGSGPSPVTYLDSLRFDQIVNLYGPPYRNKSFGQDTLNINGQQFARGLGTHAPATLCIDLNGKASRFTASVGIDHEITKLWDPELKETIENFPKYVYDNRVDHYDPQKGGTAVFKVLVDGKVAFQSKIMDVYSDPQKIEVNLEGAEKLQLVADETEDGSYADHVDWAGAKITWKEKPGKEIAIYKHPEKVLVNHIGFLPGGIKTCYMYGKESTTFKVISKNTGNQVFKGKMQPNEGDLGKYLIGDFTGMEKKGKFYIQADGRESVIFEIGKNVYLNALHANTNYINQQRSGDPDEGWTKGEHLDDGVRQDNGKHQDVTGGWYDASDLRKPMRGNSLLLLALAKLSEADLPGFDKMNLLDEMKWGNRFLFAMQEPEGYVMSYIGSTKNGMMENRWTDNKIGTEDDRTILTDPADANHQMIFAMANALINKVYRDVEPEYAKKCLDAAAKAWNWTRENRELSDPNQYGIALSTAIALHKASGEERYFEQAVKLCRSLLEHQQSGNETLSGHFFRFEDKAKTYGGRWIMMGLRDFGNAYPEHDLVSKVQNTMMEFADGYYQPLVATNSFSIVPWIIATKPLGSGKQLGPYYYRNFLHVGMNQHLSSQGCALVSAYNALDTKEYLEIAQKQLDWIYGANPFNASSVTGLGYNQPALFKTLPEEFKPHTPKLRGGVMTGIGSNPNDKIAFFPGWWWTTEYWSPSVTYTMLLTTFLQKNYEDK
jgi:hypothetical protein